MLLGRACRRGAAWLALIAICLQVAIVFPHICPDDVASLGHSGLGPAFSAATPDLPELPLCPLSEGRGGGSCVIYATGHLAGTSLLPDAIRLGPTRRDGLGLRASDAPLQLSRAAHLLFQTRAPPIA